MLDLRSGWILIVSFAFTAIFASAFVIVSLMHPHAPTIGNGRDVSTYGFDLSTCLIPRDQIVAGGLAKDELHALVNPKAVPVSSLKLDEPLEGIRRLWPSERVVGVTRNGENRAYPLWILTWHEVCNDTLGGEPIAVTYNPLCDSVVVFDRTQSGEVLEFGVSGLLYNSNLVMFDRHPAGEPAARSAADAPASRLTSAPSGESLWSQLQFRAIAGPAAVRGETLAVLPCQVTTFRDWEKQHSETTLVLPIPERGIPYRRDAYLPYFGDEKLRFPVASQPAKSPPGWELKTPLVAELRDGTWKYWAVTDPAAPSGEADVPRVYAFWFAWYALRQ